MVSKSWALNRPDRTLGCYNAHVNERRTLIFTWSIWSFEHSISLLKYAPWKLYTHIGLEGMRVAGFLAAHTLGYFVLVLFMVFQPLWRWSSEVRSGSRTWAAIFLPSIPLCNHTTKTILFKSKRLHHERFRDCAEIRSLFNAPSFAPDTSVLPPSPAICSWWNTEPSVKRYSYNHTCYCSYSLRQTWRYVLHQLNTSWRTHTC